MHLMPFIPTTFKLSRVYFVSAGKADGLSGFFRGLFGLFITALLGDAIENET
jgi:hypothetical protein